MLRPARSHGNIKIYGMNGEIIKTYELKVGSNLLEISLAEFASGLYLCYLNIDNGRIIKHRKLMLSK